MSSSLRRRVDDPRLVLGVIALASGAILAVALLFQYIGNLHPCQLCVYQRVPYAVAGPVALLSLLLVGRLGTRGIAAIALFCAIVFAAGTGVAIFHVGVEQHWWAGLASCGSVVDSNLSFEALKRQLLAAPIVRCDEIQWSMWGISMAGYNAILSAFLSILVAAVGLALWKNDRRPQPAPKPRRP